jgi:ABC-type Fe3+-siderophore transport system permease subunit
LRLPDRSHVSLLRMAGQRSQASGTVPMNEEIAEAAEAEASMVSLFTSLPRWARTAIAVIFFAECAVLAAGLARNPAGDPGIIRIDLSAARPAPGFSTL